MKTVAAVLLLTLFRPANALPTPRRIPDILQGVEDQKRRDRQEPELRLGDAATGDVETSHIAQRLDHFSDEKEGKHATYRQRYFYSARYVHEEASPDKALAFLCVGGEGPSLSASVLHDSVHCTGDMIGAAEKLHKEHGMDVHLFALEHRYYGDSFPSSADGRAGFLRGGEDEEEDEDEPFEVDYGHLSSRQAVQDVIAFVKSPEVSKRISSDEVTWITFGGSYPGMLSAWSHLLHPDVIFAAVSSSAPVQAQLDFPEYNEWVGRDLGDETVGGSESCERIFRKGHEEVVAELEGKGISPEDGVERVATLFNVCGGADALRASRRNQEAFVGDGLINVPAQGNDPACNGEVCNIKGLCEAIVDEQKSNSDISAMEVLANVKKIQSSRCEQVDWKAYLGYYGTPMKQNANDRSWLYQTCTEFGFYMTCNKDSECPYGRGYHDVSRDLEMCQVVFGIDPDDVKRDVDSTLTYYGGWSLTPDASEQKFGPTASGNAGSVILENGEGTLGGSGQKQLLFLTGSVDPWTALAVTKGNKDHPSVEVTGSSHHFWTHEVKDSDAPEITVARQTIYETLERWLGVEPVEGSMSEGGEGVVVDIE